MLFPFSSPYLLAGPNQKVVRARSLAVLIGRFHTGDN
jgi:hypothetical protein